MTAYELTIGLEVHAQLRTQTKMFSSSKNDPDEERPNTNISVIDLAHPGTLPTINKKAIEHVLRVGVAVGGSIADFTEFDRKNYFYPDIPKGYQISQYKYPLVAGGSLAGVALTRIHLEEDTARSQHIEGDAAHSIVDYNRAGAPLMELVTEPVIKTAQQASDFARELQLLLRYLGASDANMEKGEMRVEANISIAMPGERGTKVEVKNLNSFKAVEKAIAYEYDRQARCLDQGDEIVQETRGWDEVKQETFSQRTKETAEDYRYFPEPDLPKLKISEIPEFDTDVLVGSLPELPWEKRDRYMSLGLRDEDADTLVRNELLWTFFDEVLKYVEGDRVSLSANYLLSDVSGQLEENGLSNMSPKTYADAIALVAEGVLSSRGAKDLLSILIKEGGEAKDIAKKRGLLQISDKKELETIVKHVIEENPHIVEEYKSGKVKVIGFLVGESMKASKGAGNPQLFKEILESLLK